MTNLIQSQKDFPNGFHGENSSHTRLQVGELTMMLKKSFGSAIRFNRLTHYVECQGRPVQSHELDSLYVSLSEKGWDIEKRKAMDALLTHARRNSYHPVVEYLEQIERDESVKPVDLGRIATDYLGTSDALYDLMMRATLIGAVARVMEPGCKFDTCTVLQGSQGVGKSTFWKELASPEWFSDTPQDKDQDLRLLIQTCWIYEFAELEHVTSKREAGALKAMLSSSIDKFRAPYAASLQDYPRPSIIVGTCNCSDFLRDPTGSRRYWVIPLPQNTGEKLDIKRLRRDRDMIWKAAVAAYRSGEQPILSPGDEKESLRRNQGFEPEDPWIEMISKWIQESGATDFTINEALIGSSLRRVDQLNQASAKAAGIALRSLGYDRVQRRQGGRRKWIWTKALPVTSVARPIASHETVQIDCPTGDSGEMSHVTNDFSRVLDTSAVEEAGHNELVTCDGTGKSSDSSDSWSHDCQALTVTGAQIGSSWDASDDKDDPAWGPPISN